MLENKTVHAVRPIYVSGLNKAFYCHAGMICIDYCQGGISIHDLRVELSGWNRMNLEIISELDFNYFTFLF